MQKLPDRGEYAVQPPNGASLRLVYLVYSLVFHHPRPACKAAEDLVWLMAVGTYEVIRLFDSSFFNAAGCPPTLLTSGNTSGGAGLVANNPTHAQVVLV